MGPIVLRAPEIYSPGPCVRAFATLVTTGAGDARMREERNWTAADAITGAWRVDYREAPLDEVGGDWTPVQSLELATAPDGAVVLRSLENHATGKRMRFTRRKGGGKEGTLLAPGLVLMPATLRQGEVHEDVCPARTGDIPVTADGGGEGGGGGLEGGGLAGSGRVRAWITDEAGVSPRSAVLHVQLVISAGPAIIQRRTQVRLRQRADATWATTGDLATLRVLVGPIEIEQSSRDAEALTPEAIEYDADATREEPALR
jgi:hypothetical protein